MLSTVCLAFAPQGINFNRSPNILCMEVSHAQMADMLGLRNTWEKQLSDAGESISIHELCTYGSPSRRLYPLHVLYELVEATRRMLVTMLRSTSNTANQWLANTAAVSRWGCDRSKVRGIDPQYVVPANVSLIAA